MEHIFFCKLAYSHEYILGCYIPMNKDRVIYVGYGSFSLNANNYDKNFNPEKYP
jgi:hypothetical protein